MDMQEQEKELFSGYEVKTWNFSPRIYKIIAASAVFNLLVVMVFAQTNMLTRKGCDSPLVSSICQVLDAVYVGSALFGTDSEYVSKDYQKTELEDADITYIDVSGQTPPLEYPEGYFALANPEEFAAMQNPDFSTVPPFDSSSFSRNSTFPNSADLMGQPQVTPTPNNNAIQGTVPDKPFDFGGGSATTVKRPKTRTTYKPKPYKFPKGKSESPGELPKLDGDETAKNEDASKGKGKKEEKQPEKVQTPIESESVKEVEINKKVFEDFGVKVSDKVASKEVDLKSAFTLVMEGTITADGKLDDKKSKFIKIDGDKEIINVAKDAIEAVGDSGILGYLKVRGIDKITFKLIQDEKQIYAVISSDQKTPEKANTIASGINGLLSTLIIADANGWKKLDKDSKTLVNGAKITSEGKNFILNFAIPKSDAQEMINRKLQEAQAKKNQPNSTAQNDNANQKTAK